MGINVSAPAGCEQLEVPGQAGPSPGSGSGNWNPQVRAAGLACSVRAYSSQGRCAPCPRIAKTRVNAPRRAARRPSHGRFRGGCQHCFTSLPSAAAGWLFSGEAVVVSQSANKPRRPLRRATLFRRVSSFNSHDRHCVSFPRVRVLSEVTRPSDGATSEFAPVGSRLGGGGCFNEVTPSHCLWARQSS